MSSGPRGWGSRILIPNWLRRLQKSEGVFSGLGEGPASGEPNWGRYWCVGGECFLCLARLRLVVRVVPPVEGGSGAPCPGVEVGQLGYPTVGGQTLGLRRSTER